MCDFICEEVDIGLQTRSKKTTKASEKQLLYHNMRGSLVKALVCWGIEGDEVMDVFMMGCWVLV